MIGATSVVYGNVAGVTGVREYSLGSKSIGGVTLTPTQPLFNVSVDSACSGLGGALACANGLLFCLRCARRQ